MENTNYLALMTGIDIPLPEIQIIMHQPTIKEISFIGEQTFFLGLQTLMINTNMFASVQGNSLLESTTNFQIFMTIMNEQETRDKKEAAMALLQIVFPSYQVNMTPRTILLTREDGQSLIDDTNFDVLQNYLREIFCVNAMGMENSTFNPADEKAREIAEKLMRGRQRVAQQKGESKGSALSRYISILTIGLNAMTLSEAINLTIYQVYDLIERYSLYLNWDLDIRSRLAGGKPDSKPDDWMKNIH